MELDINGNSFQLKLAEEKDINLVIQLLVQAAKWLKTKGTTQWDYYITNLEGNVEEVRASIVNRNTYLLLDKEIVVASMTLEEQPNDWDCEIWGQEAHNESVVYLHRLVAHRNYAGLGIGKKLIDCAMELVENKGKGYIRFDCIGSNDGLNAYYQNYYELKDIANIYGKHCKYEISHKESKLYKESNET